MINKMIWLLLGALLLVSACSDELMQDTNDLSTTHESPKVRHKCNSTAHMKKLLQNPAYLKDYNQRMDAMKRYEGMAFSRAACSTPTVVPVAVHFQGISGANPSCLIELTKRQIASVNKDFSATNDDISKWTSNASSSYPNVGLGSACMTFTLANQNHPGGYGLSNGDLAITVNKTNGEDLEDWRGYLNIVVKANTGSLGYAPLGGSGDGDVVVVDVVGFGVGGGCGSVTPYETNDLGRTLTHEIGHYLLLDHIWGDGCGIDDEVADTPPQADSNYGCPGLNTSSCGSRDLHMNYMDYTDDACMYMFTAGQAQRMENYLAANLTNLTSNATRVIGGITNPGGGDNGGDGEEPTAVCQSPTDASVQNLSETEVKVDWSDISGAKRYRVRYRIAGTSRWSALNSQQSHATLTGLDAGTVYEYQVRTRCASGWQPFTTIATFATEGEDGGEEEPTQAEDIEMILTLDDYGSETTWAIYDAAGTTVYSGGPYRDGRNGHQIKKTLSKLTSGCYIFEIEDYYGDGICCEYGDGQVEFTMDGESLALIEGSYGTYAALDICISTSSARLSDTRADAKRVARRTKKK